MMPESGGSNARRSIGPGATGSGGMCFGLFNRIYVGPEGEVDGIDLAVPFARVAPSHYLSGSIGEGSDRLRDLRPPGSAFADEVRPFPLPCHRRATQGHWGWEAKNTAQSWARVRT